MTDLCTTPRQQTTFGDMCRKNYYPENRFDEINNAVSENLINALSILNQAQDSFEKNLQRIDNCITTAKMKTATQRDKNYSPNQSINRNWQLPAAPYKPRNKNLRQTYRNFYRGINFRGRNFFNRNQRPRLPNTNAQLFHPRNLIQSQLQLPTRPDMPVTRSGGTFCYTCGYSNHR